MTADCYLQYIGRRCGHEPYAALAAGGRAGAKRAVRASHVWSHSTSAARTRLFFKALRKPK
jgi:hypothetical protein